MSINKKPWLSDLPLGNNGKTNWETVPAGTVIGCSKFIRAEHCLAELSCVCGNVFYMTTYKIRQSRLPPNCGCVSLHAPAYMTLRGKGKIGASRCERYYRVFFNDTYIMTTNTLAEAQRFYDELAREEEPREEFRVVNFPKGNEMAFWLRNFPMRGQYWAALQAQRREAS